MDEFVDGRNPARGEDPPVTAVASRRVKPGREREFEEWVSGILEVVNKFPGYLGSEILRPSDPEDDEYRIIFRFDHASNLRAWENSEERHHWLRQSRPLLHEKEKVHVLTGLETWFTLPSKPGEPAPPRYKMAIVTWLAVFPVVAVIFSLFDQWLNLLPTLLRTGLHGGDGHADDLRHHAPHDAPVLFLALSGARVASSVARSAKASADRRVSDQVYI